MTKKEPDKRGRGRPPEITPEVRGNIVRAIRAGSYVETAAAFAGKSKDTLYRWLRLGAGQAAGPYREFSDAVEKAWADAELGDLATIGKAAMGYEVTSVRTKEIVDRDTGKVVALVERETTTKHEFAWQAAAWRLERKFPQRWGRRPLMIQPKEGDDEDSLTVIIIGGSEKQYIEGMRQARGALPLPSGDET